MILIDHKQLPYIIRTGGEVHFSYIPSCFYGAHHVEAKIENSDDIIGLLLLDSVVEIENLSIFYLPYARQDRKFDYEPFSLKVICNLLNNLRVKNIILNNPHSDMSSGLINKSVTIQNLYPPTLEYNKIIAPDQGAYKKLSPTFDNLVFAVKSRDKKRAPEIKCVVGDINEGDKCIVLDDICDGGRTFIELGKKLKEMGVSKENLTLHTTYGIYSNGLEELSEYYSEISCFCTINYTGNRAHPQLKILGHLE